jgi:hypothetical protein
MGAGLGLDARRRVGGTDPAHFHCRKGRRGSRVAEGISAHYAREREGALLGQQPGNLGRRRAVTSVLLRSPQASRTLGDA